VTVYHGVDLLLHPHEVGSVGLALGVLALSLVGESWSWWVAVQAVRKSARETPFFQYLRLGSDPMGVAVLLEDSAALLGILLATLGLVATSLSGLVIFDALATLLIGLLLGGIACFIVYRNKGFLVGQRMPREYEDAVRRILSEERVVERVEGVRTAVLGPDVNRFKAEVNFDGHLIARKLLEGRDLEALRRHFDSEEALRAFLEDFGEQVVEALGDEIDRIEARIRDEVPQVSHIDLETE
jgi:zinc transporter 9